MAIGNLLLLRDVAVNQKDFMHVEIAELQTVEVFRNAPDIALRHTIDDNIMPQLRVGDYLDATKELGSPVNSVALEGLQRLPHVAVDRVMRNLFGSSIKMESGSQSIQGLKCGDFGSSAETTVSLGVPSGQSFLLRSDKAGSAFISMGLLDPPTGEAVQEIKLQAATPVWVHMPDTGQPIEFRLQIRAGSGNTIQVCAPNSS